MGIVVILILALIQGAAELLPVSSSAHVIVAGQLLGMSERSAYRAVARGELPTITAAGTARVPTAALYLLLGLPIPPRPGAPLVDGGR